MYDATNQPPQAGPTPGNPTTTPAIPAPAAPPAIPPAPPAPENPPEETPAPAPAPPPTASLATGGELTDERAIALERQNRELQTRVSELERDKQELLKPTSVPVKVKRPRAFPTIIGSQSEDE